MFSSRSFLFEAFGSFWRLATMYGGEVVGHEWRFLHKTSKHQSNKLEMEDLYQVYLYIYIWGVFNLMCTGSCLFVCFFSYQVVLEIPCWPAMGVPAHGQRSQVWVSWRPRAPAPMVPWWNDSDFTQWLCLGTRISPCRSFAVVLIGRLLICWHNPKKKPHWITCYQILCEKWKHNDSGNARLSWAPTHHWISFW